MYITSVYTFPQSTVQARLSAPLHSREIALDAPSVCKRLLHPRILDVYTHISKCIN